MRLARADEIGWRHEASDGNLMLTGNVTDNLVFESDPVVLAGATQTLTSKKFSTGTVFSAARSINDGTKFTFYPDTKNAGITVGCFGGESCYPENGAVVYDSRANE